MWPRPLRRPCRPLVDAAAERGGTGNPEITLAFTARERSPQAQRQFDREKIAFSPPPRGHLDVPVQRSALGALPRAGHGAERRAGLTVSAESETGGRRRRGAVRSLGLGAIPQIQQPSVMCNRKHGQVKVLLWLQRRHSGRNEISPGLGGNTCQSCSRPGTESRTRVYAHT